MTQKSVKRELSEAIPRTKRVKTKNMQCRYQKITSLAIALKNLFPHATTVQIESGTISPNDVRVLFDMLVHSLTLINKLYRLKDREGNYIQPTGRLCHGLDAHKPFVCQ